MEKIKELMNASFGNFKVETLLSALLTLVVSVIVIHFLLKFIKATLKKKIDVDFRKYVILGACNPGFAFKALTDRKSVV